MLSSIRSHAQYQSFVLDQLRAFLMMLQVSQTSLTKRVYELRRVPLYAIISGFLPDHTPSVGTFYDFFSRL